MVQHPSYSDQELLQKMATGDSGAIRELYGLYWKTMYAAAFKRIPDHEVVKDILQDVFLQLWPRKNTLYIDHLPAYLYNAIRNQVFKRFEKESRYTPIETLLMELGTSSATADERVLRLDLRKAYEALLATLTPSQRQIMQLRFEEDLSTAEIAGRLNISRKTVQNQLRTAKFDFS
ncbi:RNA polymerase sigma factor [Chitinophaga sp. 22321]|uniref:Sigma-70 family RNA polymerase sigma factor n=2 Tax=Chitinophaga hostae TaxID=2831022 RepID=A0ABS5IZ01_9BACT|nr:sigma-70 family RNA polymerase sigma factor [Chitinophaga hostae]MBS0028179.1 sigma-70 family RNA polymerase sigma factor [Chitinophaga hostae]